MIGSYVIARKELDKGSLRLLFRYSGLHCFEGLETLIQPNGKTLETFGSLAEAVNFIITSGLAETAEVRICEEARDKDRLSNGINFAPVSYSRGSK